MNPNAGHSAGGVRKNQVPGPRSVESSRISSSSVSTEILLARLQADHEHHSAAFHLEKLKGVCPSTMLASPNSIGLGLEEPAAYLVHRRDPAFVEQLRFAAIQPEPESASSSQADRTKSAPDLGS